MKIVLQRVRRAKVEVDERKVCEIGRGYLLLTGFERGDDATVLSPMLEKIRKIKLFPDQEGRSTYSLEEVGGSLLAVSQFTLSAELKKGKKPSFSKALDPKAAERLYDEFVELCKDRGVPTRSGVFGAYMQVTLENDGPVTLLLNSKELFPSLHQ